MAHRGTRNFLVNAALVLGSVVFSFAVLETCLWADSLLARFARTPTAATKVAPSPAAGSGFEIPPEVIAAGSARRLTTMPKEWERRSVRVPGAASAYYWLGVLHVHDKNRFRRTTPFPEKDPNVFRVLVVGDSLTYGAGLDEKDTFVALLNAWMEKEYRIEFLNLGVLGNQSEDVLRVVKTFLPQLHPDLVIYAVCLNDFSPSGAGEYHDESLYAVPIPEPVKRFLVAHTRSGAFLRDKYDAALRSVHLRRDFYDDVLLDFRGYETRFRRDVKDLNATVKEAGLPPVLSLVVNQYPSYESRGHRIARIAENALTQAGAEVIPTEDYYRRYNNQAMYISKWDGHPNEVAAYIWATMLAGRMRQKLAKSYMR